MNGPVPASSPGPTATDRLSGWKDIATFLGKGVRTVQRWEKEFGLPVHRIGKDGGEIVLASKHEIEQWLETWTHRSSSGHPDDAHETGTPVAEPPAPVSPAPVATPPRAPSRERRAPRWWLALAGVLITTVVGAVAGGAAGGLLGALKEAGHTDEEANVYAEGVRRGGTLVSVKAHDEELAQVQTILDGRGVSADVRGAAYRANNWSAFDPEASPYSAEDVARERALYSQL